jgi:hypothetical protein
MIEAMTEGGFKPRGVLFAPQDALFNDAVVLKYVRKYLKEIKILRGGNSYRLGNISFSSPIRHIHGDVETYGLNFKSSKYTISYITDTRFFPQLIQHYGGDILIINLLRLKPGELDHLSLEDVRIIIREIRPKVAILTHFGMTVLRARPWKIAQDLKEELRVNVIAASDGMAFDLASIQPDRSEKPSKPK